jgi:hypothetical protein
MNKKNNIISKPISSYRIQECRNRLQPVLTSVIEIVVGPGRLLFSVFRRVQLVDSRPIVGWVSSKCDVKMLQIQGKKKEN